EQVVVDVGHDQGVGALDRGQGGADGGGEVAAGHGVALLDQVHQHLGVGVRGEDVPPGGQVALEGDVVLDDAVVDHGQAPVLGEVRVRVDVVRPAVGGPAGVAQADAPGRQALRHRVLEDLQLAGALDRREATARGTGVERDEASRVVPSVLEAAEPVEDHVGGLPGPDVADDSAHGNVLPDWSGRGWLGDGAAAGPARPTTSARRRVRREAVTPDVHE